MIDISGKQGNKVRMFFLGALMTQKKKSLVYLADHVRQGVIEENVKELIEKYRRQLESHMV
jgi:hypothetical protein